MQGSTNVNSIEQPIAAQIQRIMVTSQIWLMMTTERQYSWKQKLSRVCIQYIDQAACQVPNAISYNTRIGTGIHM
jgi:hypothetical protein